MKTKPIWQDYANTFPDRYLQAPKQWAPIDTAITKWIVERRELIRPPACCLDIGGGPEGTQALKPITNGKKPKGYVWGLDPHVTQASWQEPIAWEQTKDNYFDLIIAKNSINYLTLAQIKRVVKMVSSGDIFLFNSFLQPTEIHRPFQNTKGGKSGVEHTHYNPKTKKIHHTLDIEVPHKKTIKHSFNFYPEETFRTLFQNGKLTVQPYGTNSVLYTYQAP